MSQPRSVARRAVFWSLGAAAVLVLAVVFIVWRLLSARPAWWNPSQPQLTENISRGEYLENQVVTAFHKVRPVESRTWTMELDADWINAWFATRLPLWAANRNLSWAHQVSEVNVSIEDNLVRLGARYGSGNAGQVYSIECRPVLGEDGLLALNDLRLVAGRLPVPLALAAGSLSTVTRSLPELEAALNGQAVDPVAGLSDGRRVRIRELRVADGRIAMTLETMPEH